ncbi:hypothetical protein FB451DRAFT_1387688 [Mycena latifolia]|nr:hypothetical protein FB451DRAFT_1387688 [Mycena latifolia]
MSPRMFTPPSSVFASIPSSFPTRTLHPSAHVRPRSASASRPSSLVCIFLPVHQSLLVFHLSSLSRIRYSFIVYTIYSVCSYSARAPHQISVNSRIRPLSPLYIPRSSPRGPLPFPHCLRAGTLANTLSFRRRRFRVAPCDALPPLDDYLPLTSAGPTTKPVSALDRAAARSKQQSVGSPLSNSTRGAEGGRVDACLALILFSAPARYGPARAAFPDGRCPSQPQRAWLTGVSGTYLIQRAQRVASSASPFLRVVDLACPVVCLAKAPRLSPPLNTYAGVACVHKPPDLPGLYTSVSLPGIVPTPVLGAASSLPHDPPLIADEHEHFRGGSEASQIYSSNIDDTTFYELYLWPSPKPSTLASAPSCFVMSDWATMIDSAQPARAGLDMNMPGFFAYVVRTFVAYYKLGQGKGYPDISLKDAVNRGYSQGTMAMGWGSSTANFPYLIGPLQAITTHIQSVNPTVVIDAILNDFNLALLICPSVLWQNLWLWLGHSHPFCTTQRSG